MYVCVCVCDSVEQINAFHKNELLSKRWFQSSLNSSSKEKIKYAKEKFRGILFSLCQTEIYVEHTIQMYLQLCTLRTTISFNSWY